ncbi:toll/interleukin-1 receptor domain-containing protein [Streptomyces sp. NPDC055025]
MVMSVVLGAAAPPGLIFISHSRRDRASAMALVSRLREIELDTWISGPELHCPAWQDMIFPHIERCAAVVVLASGHAAGARGVIQEVAYAELLGKPVLSVSPKDVLISPKSALTPFPAVRTVRYPRGAGRFAAPGRWGDSARALCMTPGSS